MRDVVHCGTGRSVRASALQAVAPAFLAAATPLCGSGALGVRRRRGLGGDPRRADPIPGADSAGASAPARYPGSAGNTRLFLSVPRHPHVGELGRERSHHARVGRRRPSRTRRTTSPRLQDLNVNWVRLSVSLF